jgi:hypothetical protein
MKKGIATLIVATCVAAGAFAEFSMDVAMPVGGGAVPWIDFNFGGSKLGGTVGVLLPLSFGDNFAFGVRGGVVLTGVKGEKASLTFPIYANFAYDKPDGLDSTFNIGIWGGAKASYFFTPKLGIFAKASVEVFGVSVGGKTIFGLIDNTKTEIGVTFKFK